ncbi:hypothetical protein [Lyngbya sp. CCY1209]|uniref:hypothetical protein n=1 Tax=Lyngbya sp. CCY1209 TaxID=2886103 RepID=UPI002D20F31A|nr:hypothetical protein [Lyngbya sp. CCY1209]MEB3884082.1 hypothetical protein [Lyngbya sp. CCY1209]
MSTLFDLSAYTADPSAVGDYDIDADPRSAADPAWDDLDLLAAMGARSRIARSPGISESELARHLGWTTRRLRQSLDRVRDRVEPHGDGWRLRIPPEQADETADADPAAIPLEQTDETAWKPGDRVGYRKAPHLAGEVAEILPSGRVKVRWPDGSRSACHPRSLVAADAADVSPDSDDVVLGETPSWEPGARVLHPRTGRRGEVAAVLPSGRVRVSWDGGGRRSAVLPSGLVTDPSPWKPGDRFRENSRLGILIERQPSRRVPDGWYAEFDGGRRCLVSERYIEPAPLDADGQFCLLASDSPADPDEPPEPGPSHPFHAGDTVRYEGEVTPYRVEAIHGDPRKGCDRVQICPPDGSPRWERPEVLRKLDVPDDPSTPPEQPKKKRRSPKGRGTGRIQWCEANKKRNAAKGKPPNRYAIYQYSYTDDGGLQVKRSVTLKKSQVARVAEAIESGTPHTDILAMLGVPKK